jgi:hypothetical protein
MNKITLLNPGAYSIFIRQLNRDDGLTITHINDACGWTNNYANSLLKENTMPSFNKCVSANKYFTQYFMENTKWARHLRKTVEVYEPIDVIDWIESEVDDLSLWLQGFEQDKSNFMKSDLPALETGDIKFKKLMLFTINIDRYEESFVGDYIGLSMDEFERGRV